MAQRAEQTLTERLAEIVDEIRHQPLPTPPMQKAKMCCLDFLAACYGGLKSKTTGVALSVVKGMGEGRSTLIGQEHQGSFSSATFFNGMIAHAEELDDAHRYVSGLHLSATIFPAVLAIGEDRQIRGEQFVKAVVSGYEVSSRICRSIDRGHRERGFHSTGTLGPFGACAASAVAMGLEKETLVHAFGITGSTAAGLFAFLEDGATVKHLHAGRASMDGLLAALLAENGMTGPRAMLEAREGFFTAYAIDANPDEITRPLEDKYEILFAYHKIHAACGHAFPAIDAALLLREERRNQLSSIQSIEIRTYNAAAVLDKKSPRSVQDARFSIPFLVGLALVRGHVRQSDWTTENLRDPQITTIASKVAVREDTEISANFPRLRAAVLVARMGDGKVIEKRIDVPRGMPDNSLNQEDIEQKFYIMSEEMLDPFQQEQIVQKIRTLDTLGSVTELTSLLRRS